MARRFGYILFLILLLLSSCKNRSKDNLAKADNDSIAKYLKLAGNDSLSISERDKWNEKAFSLVFKKENTFSNRRYTYDIICNYYEIKKWDEYKKASNFLLINSLSTGDKLNIARSYRSKGNYYHETQILDSSYYFYLKSEKIYKESNDYDGYSTVLLKKGIIQYRIGDYLGADLSLSTAYFISKNLNNKSKIYGSLNQLGLVSKQLREYDKAIDYFESALDVVKKNKIKTNAHEEEVCLSNLALVYLDMGEYRRAIPYFEKCLLDKEIRYDNCILYANIIENLGCCMLKLNSNNGVSEMFYESLKIRDSLKSPDITMTYVTLSEYYKNINILKAIAYSEKALLKAKKSKSTYYYLIALSHAGYINKDKASKYMEEYSQKSDSIQLEERKTRNQFFKILLETNEIEKEKETAIKQKWVIVSIISGVLLIVILLFIIYRQRTKHIELGFLQNQQNANEKIYQLMFQQHSKIEEAKLNEKKRIALELHDGIMNKLASTRLNLFVLSKKTDSETINNCLNYIKDIHQIENEIRNLSHDLNQDFFQEKDTFIELLNDFIREQNKFLITNYELQMDENINWELISSAIKMHLYRIIQEASYNINKHAKATNVIICITIDTDNLHMSVTDNGVGFNPEKIKEGIGLKNMQQRIQSLNGIFSIKTKKSKGTALHLRIPIH